jgi:hypothetical protein
MSPNTLIYPLRKISSAPKDKQICPSLLLNIVSLIHHPFPLILQPQTLPLRHKLHVNSLSHKPKNRNPTSVQNHPKNLRNRQSQSNKRRHTNTPLRTILSLPPGQAVLLRHLISRTLRPRDLERVLSVTRGCEAARVDTLVVLRLSRLVLPLATRTVLGRWSAVSAWRLTGPWSLPFSSRCPSPPCQHQSPARLLASYSATARLPALLPASP